MENDDSSTENDDSSMENEGFPFQNDDFGSGASATVLQLIGQRTPARDGDCELKMMDFY